MLIVTAQRLKPRIDFAAFTAPLKRRPDTNHDFSVRITSFSVRITSFSANCEADRDSRWLTRP
ncbi:MAG: hypothetical protein DMG80_20695 [Acidobacteria bacterium]|nr:MAG: hypothetical protein DMG80_20695 [Acidobacteriota bacterium]